MKTFRFLAEVLVLIGFFVCLNIWIRSWDNRYAFGCVIFMILDAQLSLGCIYRMLAKIEEEKKS